MFKAIHKMQRGEERGFTLIELLIVIAIIAILAVIAIPQFAAYRQRAIKASMQSDARNAATLEEAAYADNQSYEDETVAYPNSGTIGGQTVRPSSGNTITITGATTAYTIAVSNTSITDAASDAFVLRSNGTIAWQ